MRGKNPASHNNKPKLNVINREVGLTPEQWEAVEKAGDGKISAGARFLINRGISATSDCQDIFSKLPLVGKVKLALELLLENDERGRELGEALLFDLQDLEIESLYSEAQLEGVFSERESFIA